MTLLWSKRGDFLSNNFLLSSIIDWKGGQEEAEWKSQPIGEHISFYYSIKGFKCCCLKHSCNSLFCLSLKKFPCPVLIQGDITNKNWRLKNMSVKPVEGLYCVWWIMYIICSSLCFIRIQIIMASPVILWWMSGTWEWASSLASHWLLFSEQHLSTTYQTMGEVPVPYILISAVKYEMTVVKTSCLMP